jgi:hypothetical protein
MYFVLVTSPVYGTAKGLYGPFTTKTKAQKYLDFLNTQTVGFTLCWNCEIIKNIETKE